MAVQVNLGISVGGAVTPCRPLLPIIAGWLTTAARTEQRDPSVPQLPRTAIEGQICLSLDPKSLN
jgi:hypothetical protein